MGAAEDRTFSQIIDPLDLFSGRSATDAAREQYAAQEAALAQQQKLFDEAQAAFAEQSDRGIGYIQAGTAQGADALQGYLGGAMGQIGQGRDASLGAYGQAQQAAMGSLGAGYGQGRSDIAGGYSQGRDDLASAYGQARGDLGQLTGLQGYGATAAQGINAYDVAGRAQDRLGGMLDQRGGLYGGFEQDPGYQFRRQQGEEAIMRQASAQGGRMGGGTLKALADYNQGLASQEYGNFANRRQAEAGISGGSDQARLSALTNQAGRSDAAALAAQQNQMGLAGIGYGAQGQMANLAGQYGGQQANMSTAGGQALGGLAYGYGAGQAGMQQQYGQNVADLYQQTYGQGAQMQYGTGANLSNLYSGAGTNMANIAIGVGGNAQQGANSMAGAYGNFANYGGMVSQAEANAHQSGIGNILGIAGLIASDARLKADIVPAPSRFAAIGLQGYRWRWNETAERLGLHGVGEGVLAQDVARLHPSAVGEWRGGFLGVDYLALDRLLPGGP